MPSDDRQRKPAAEAIAFPDTSPPSLWKSFLRLPALRLAGRLWLGVRRTIRPFKWRTGFKRLEALRGIGNGRRAFLLGSGPSLAAMNLTRLDGEFVCVANMGIRAVGSMISHADMHVVTDIFRYQRFSEEIEAIALRNHVPYRFVTHKGRGIWRRLRERANEPLFLVAHLDRLSEMEGDRLPPMSEGVLKGPSVLLSAAVLLEYLGFSPIYVLGCDLDYDGSSKYFYDMKALDMTHEADHRIIERRTGIPSVDAHFAILRRAFESNGTALLNAGVGGNLHSLPRVDFDALFSRDV